MDNKQIGNRIKSRRKELKLTLNEVAEMVGVASSTIQRYENGYISQCKLPVLESIAKAINVNPTWLIREDANMETGIPDSDFIKQNKTIVSYSKPITFNIDLSDYIESKNKEKSLLDAYNKLNDLGKNEAIKRISELSEIPKYCNAVELPNKKEEADEEYIPHTIAAHADGLIQEQKEDMINMALQHRKNLDK